MSKQRTSKQTSWRRFQYLRDPASAFGRYARRVHSATSRHAQRFLTGKWQNIRRVRRRIVGWMILVGGLIVVSGVQLSWFQQNYTTTTWAKGGTYAEAVRGPVNSLNPLFAATSAERSAARLLFSSLFRYDRTGHLAPDLARSITHNDKGTEYTVTLRDDVRWHDGTHLTAKDVAFTIGLIKNPAVRSTITGWQHIQVRVINDHSLQFVLPAAYASFPHALTFPVVPRHALQEVEPALVRENAFSQKPIGTGPFQFRLSQVVQAGSDRRIVYLAAFEGYHGGTPRLSRFQLHTYGSSEAIMRAVRLGEVNGSADLSRGEAASLRSEHFTVESHPTSSAMYTLFNTQRPVLSKLAVRRALQHGTDTAAIRQAAAPDAPGIHLPFIRGQLTHKAPAAPIYDKAVANKLLDEAGWKRADNGLRVDDKGQPLKLSITALKNGETEKVVELLSGQWRALGIDIETQLVEGGDGSQRITQTVLRPRNFDVLVYPIEIGADPDVYAYWHSSQVSRLNYSGYANAVADDALASARSRHDMPSRLPKYEIFARQWLQDAPAIGLYQVVTQYAHIANAYAGDAAGIYVTPQDRYSDVHYWATERRSVYKTP